MESRKLIALLLVPALLCSGCSMLWVRGPKEVDPSAPPSTALPECSTSRGLPTLDIVLGVVDVVGGAAALVGAGVLVQEADNRHDAYWARDSADASRAQATILGAVGAAAVVEAVLLFISGGVGNANVTACRESRAQHAAQQQVPNPLLMAAQDRAVPTHSPLAPATPRFGSECTHDAECAAPNICTYGHCVENGGTL